MATSFRLESMDSTKAVVSFSTAQHNDDGVIVGRTPRRRYTVTFNNCGVPGAIRATCEDGHVTTLGMFRIDADTPHPGYMKLRNRVSEVRRRSDGKG